MSGLNKDLLLALYPMLDQALDLPRAERTAWLERFRAEHPAVAPGLEFLLAQEDQLEARGFLEREDWGDLVDAAPSYEGLTVGAYTLDRSLGRGGMGSVWLAHRSDGRYQGLAAVKLLNLSLLDPVGRERFRREGTLVASLAHPGIARLIDAGVTGPGQPYLVLEYVEGLHLDEYCDRQRLPPERRLALFLQVLAAVGHAHAHLIVHRDLKPSNILVTADGSVKLLDFGIAKLLESDSEAAERSLLTDLGGLALTPEFAAPEQASGRQVTTATDVYALGVLLYLLLAGQHPTGPRCRTAAEHIRAVLDTEPPRLSAAVRGSGPVSASDLARVAEARATTVDRLARLYRGDLDNILLKALKKNPVERYASVMAFGDDLERYLKHQPVTARPDSVGYRATKFMRRNRTGVTLAALIVLAMAAGLVGTMTQARAAAAQRDFALRQLARAEAVNDLNGFLLSDAAPSGRPFTVGHLLAQAESVVMGQHGDSGANRVEMLVSIGQQYATLDETGKARRMLERAHALSRTLTDPSARARAGCALGSIVSRSGERDRAERFFREALAELPEEPQFAMDRIFCLLRGGEIARHAMDGRTSVERTEAARALVGQVPFSSEVLAMRVEMDVAESYRVADQFLEANRAFEQAARHLAALGREETETAGTLYNNWALSLYLAGRPLEAETLFRRAVRLASSESGESTVSPMLLTNLARTLSRLARHQEARDYAERAYAEARKAGEERVLYQALLVLATIYRELGDLDRSAGVLAEAEQYLERMFPAGHVVFFALAREQALLAQARGDLGAAEEALARALAIVEGEDQLAAVRPALLLRRSDLALQSGRVAQATRDAVLGLELIKQVTEAGTPSAGLGAAYLSLGRALRAQGDTTRARATFAAALEQLRPTLGPDHPDTRLAAESARK
jgi:serine/threonine-protein kinase